MSATATGGHERRGEPRRRRVPARLLRLASDERLVDALRDGSEAAFEVIYTRHHRGVLSFCRHMLGSVEEAEDAVQHTFLAAYRDVVGSSKPIRLRPWLYTIARNRCLSMLRARRERASGELVEPSTEHLAHEVERRHDLRSLLGDLAGLPHDQRAALVLTELGDMSHDEIGDVLGCPREKVKALVFQARSSLIASRNARETSCEEIRAQLANLRGSSLRRNTLRRHLRECPGCREYRDQVLSQRNALALILPVAPTLGLKATVLGAAGVTAAAGGTASVVATAVVTLCVVGGGTAAVDITRHDDGNRPEARKPRPARVVPAAAAAPVETVAEPAATPQAGRRPVRRREIARPVRARGPKPKVEKARGPKPKVEKARGPKPKVEKVRGPKPKVERARVAKPEKVRVPKPKVEKIRGPKPKAEKPEQAAREPGPPTEPPGQAKKN